MNLPAIYTIGVYGLSENEFFQKLLDNNIDTFCDIRRRRAVRGAQYAFVNSKRLQQKLDSFSIRYLYEAGLAPTNEIRQLQSKADEINKIPTRQREELDPDFKSAYIKKILSRFDFELFIKDLEKLGTKKLALFCVERYPAACHRSLVTNKMKELYPRIKIFNL